jgi:hypothetical protein
MYKGCILCGNQRFKPQAIYADSARVQVRPPLALSTRRASDGHPFCTRAMQTSAELKSSEISLSLPRQGSA